MNIVVLDGYAMNPGDLNWSSLRSLGDCTIYERTLPGELLPRLHNAAIAVTNKVPITRETIARLPGLQYIGVTATGYNIVDVGAARERKIVVTNVPAYSTDSVAQLVFALILEFTHGVGRHSLSVRQGRWSANPDFSFWDFPLTELAGKTIGIVGYGNIGRTVATIAAAFRMKVVVSSRSPVHLSDNERVTVTDTDSLLRQSDFVTLHCPLTPETERLIDRRRLSLMKPEAVLINTGRGGLVDEDALAEALNTGRLAGAGLDVLSSEPPSKDNPLLTAANCLITPHFGWATVAARKRLMEVVVGNIRSFLDGKPVNVVT